MLRKPGSQGWAGDAQPASSACEPTRSTASPLAPAPSAAGRGGATAKASSTTSIAPRRFRVRTMGTRGEASSWPTHSSFLEPSTSAEILVLNPRCLPG
ncbi:MAG: hypothetical protein HY721_16455 [Planctomycetes bacterium]|nr:hypothetical protein [Planctomycetota bacterium]